METHYLVVNSNLRDTTLYPSGNSYTMHLTNPIHDVTRVELIQASVPNVIQNVVDGSNIIQVSNLETNSLHSFSIPNGFYSATGLGAEIQNAINPVSGIDVTYLSNEGRYAFLRSNVYSAFDLKPSAVLANLMGFSDTSTRTAAEVQDLSNATATFPLYANNDRYRENFFLKSDQLINLTADNYVYLDINELNNGRMHQAQKIEVNSFSTSASQYNFGPIVMDVSSGGIKHFSETNDYNYGVDFYPPISQLSRVTVRLMKSYGSIINFHVLNENSFLLKINRNFR